MDGSWTIVVLATLGVFVKIGAGAGARRLGILTAEADRSLMNLVICVLMPCFIFSNILGKDALDNPDASALALPPTFGFLSVAVGMAVAWAVAWLVRVPGMTGGRERRTFALGVGLYNYGYLPIPLIEALEENGVLPDSTLPVLFVHNVGVDLSIWTIGVLVLQGQLAEGWWKKVINPPTVAVALGILAKVTGAADYLPKVILTVAHDIGQAGIPMSMILIGATMMDQVSKTGEDKEPLFNAPGMLQMLLAIVVRMGILPVAFLAIAMLPLSADLRRVIVIQAAMPAAVFPVVLARMYHGNPKVATRIVIGTSLVSIVTIPLWIYAGLTLLK